MLNDGSSHWGGRSILLGLLIQTLISSGKALIDILRKNVQRVIWASPGLVKLK